MALVIVIGAGLGLAALLYSIDIYRHRHPLTNDQIVALAKKRQRNIHLSEYSFQTTTIYADPSYKAAMAAVGEFVDCQLDYRITPAKVAGLLKYKKHEWIVIVFVKNHISRRIWWNKGADANSVYLALTDQDLHEQVRRIAYDTVLILHNHPNPFPSGYSINKPSPKDLESAISFHRKFNEMRLNLLEFICERGIPRLYYAGFVTSPISLWLLIAKIQKKNDSSIFVNRVLHKELKHAGPAEHIYGGSLDPEEQPLINIDVETCRSLHQLYEENYKNLAPRSFELVCKEMYLHYSISQKARFGCSIGQAIPSQKEYLGCVEVWKNLLTGISTENCSPDPKIMEGAGCVIHHADLFVQWGKVNC